MESARKLSGFDDYEAYQSYIEHQKRSMNAAKAEQLAIIKAKRHVSRSISKSVVLATLVAAVVGLILFRYSIIFEASYNNHELKREIEQLNITKTEMNSQLDSIVVLDNVEKVAVQELGMKYPSQEQIIYVDYPQQFKVSREKPKSDALVKESLVTGLYGKTESLLKLFR